MTEPLRHPADERSAFIDALRGFALVGICIVNLPFLAMPARDLAAVPAGADALAQVATALLAEGKFFPLFSFLFGFGVALQAARVATGRLTPAAHARRLVGLAAFGAAHAVLLFPGDILLTYAILGALLWRIRAWPDRALLRLAALLIGAAALAYLVLALLIAGITAEDRALAAAEARAAIDAYRGSFLDGLAHRLRFDLPLAALVIVLFNWPIAFAAFCAGLVAGRRGLLADPERLAAALRPHAPALALGAVIGNGLPALFPWWPPAVGVATFPLLATGGPCLAALYALGLTRLWRDPRGQAVLMALVPAGRMSLTVYLGQSLLANALFMGWGLGLYGAVDRWALPLVALAIAAVLAGGAHLWLRRFRMGPDEWLLRSFTYGRWQRLRREITPPAPAPGTPPPRG